MSMSELPAEIIEKILCRLADPEPVDSRYVCPLSNVLPTPTQARQDLAQLRLVSKSFLRYATPLLFREFNIYYDGNEALLAWHIKVELIRQKDLLQHVEILRFGINPIVLEGRRLHPQFKQDLDCMVQLLICTILRASRLKCLDLTHEFDQDVFSAYCKPLRHVTPGSNLSEANKLMRFKGVDALHISLPLKGRFCEPIDRTLLFPGLIASVKHLSVLAGGDHRRRWSDDHRSERYIWEFVGQAVHLQSLTITCNRVLDLDELPLEHLHELQQLRLCRFQISVKHFLTLVSQNSSALRAINLKDILLASGEWETIFRHLCGLPLLDHFLMDYCTYGSAAQSTIWDPFDDRYRFRRPALASHRHDDAYWLMQALKHLNEVRAKADLPLYTGGIFDQVDQIRPKSELQGYSDNPVDRSDLVFDTYATNY